MSKPTARRLRISIVVLCVGVLVCAWAWAGAVRIFSVHAQTSDTGTQQSSPPMPPPAAQASAPAAQAPANADEAEMTSQETQVPLRVLVNLVPVRVVVRDAKGNTVGTLHKEDFQLFQDGKPQVISNFSMVSPASAQHVVVAATSGPAGAAPNGPASPAFLPPSRFVALLFDDAHLKMDDAVQVRLAADRYIDGSLAPSDRAAVFTISGQFQSDFTDDHAKLHASLKGIQPRAVTATGDIEPENECPPMDYYEAEAIQNRNDSQAIEISTQDTLTCTPQAMNPQTGGPTPGQIQQAQALVTAMALRKTEEGEQKTEAVFRRLRELIGRMSTLPGQRNIVLISPGFIYPNLEVEYSEMIDHAIRQSVFISTLDARGLYTADIGGDISQRTNDPNPAYAGIRTQWRLDGQSRQTVTLLSLASDTGGWAFSGNNDLGKGLREVASPPDAYYYLAYVPNNLKFDGHFHSLKVTLATKEKYTIQARRGYFAPLHGETPQEAAARDIDDAIFSQEEQHGLPVGLQTQYYKTDPTDAKVAVLAHLDLAHVRFQKADGRNADDVTVVAAIFDRNGNYITGTEKTIAMKLRDETYAKLSRSGVTVKTSFDLKPGDYVVRLVVRDGNAAALTAENGIVEIPY